MKGILASCICCLLLAFSARAEALDCALLEREFRAASVADAMPVSGVKRILWYRLAFAADARPPQTIEQVENGLSAANATIRRASYGKVSLEWMLTPVLQLPQSASYYASFFPRLISDARAAATAAGIDWASCDLDAFGPPPIAGVASGLAMLNDRWLYVALAHGGLISHELGHCFGLPHASSWNNARPALSPLASPPFPSNIADLGGAFAFETNSLAGRVGVLNAGATQEYGDALDIMGPSDAAQDYQAAYKRHLGWLEDSQIASARWNGTFRIYTSRTAIARADRQYALRIPRPIVGRWNERLAREYWVELGASGLDEGLAIRWVEPNLSVPSIFVDAGARAYRRIGKALLPAGRSFRDEAAEIAITSLAQGGAGAERWVDVAVDLSGAPGNPTVALNASKTKVAIDESVSVGATARDALAFHWEIDRHQIAGGPAYGSGPGPLNLSWSVSGVYNVRCEVADGTGGTAAAIVSIQVGEPQSERVSGRIVDAQGRPLRGARVHNGRVDQSDFHSVETDSDGAFALNGAFHGASLYGRRSVSDFVMEPLPRVWISAPPSLTQGEASSFAIHRSGPVDQPLAVRWRSSAAPFDLSGTIPAGASSLQVSLTAPIADVLQLQVLVPTRFVRDGVTCCYPGWELAGNVWKQTDPPYVAMENSGAIIGLTAPGAAPLALQIANGQLIANGPAGWEVAIERSEDLKTWSHHSVTTLPGSVNVSAGGFYRARRL